MVGGAAVSQADGTGSMINSYFVDMLFRGRSNPPAYNPAMNTEAAHILSNAIFRNDLPPGDRDYLGQLVTSRTGLNQVDSEKRVLEVITSAKQSAESARKIAAHTLLWVFIALLIGAFCASYAATIGGRQRDHVKSI